MTETNVYDDAGRLTSVSTPEINAPSQFIWTQGSPPNGLPPSYKIRPFTASISYDEFGNLTGRDNVYWHDSTVSTQPHQAFQTTYENGRAKKDGVAGRVTTNNVNQTWLYNAAGEITYDTNTSQQYDVVGRLTKTQDANNANIFSTHTFDGDGRQVKFYQQKPDGTTETRYRLFSSVTGRLLTEIDAAGQKLETHIYTPYGEHRQMKSWTVYYSGGGYTTYPDSVVSEFADPLGTRARQWERQTNSYRDTHVSPVGVPIEPINWQALKDRFVQGIAAQISYGQSQAVYYPYLRNVVEDPTTPGRGCMLDGQKISCAKLIQDVRRGTADIDGYSSVTPTTIIDGFAIHHRWKNTGESIEEDYDVVDAGSYRNETGNHALTNTSQSSPAGDCLGVTPADLNFHKSRMPTRNDPSTDGLGHIYYRHVMDNGNGASKFAIPQGIKGSLAQANFVKSIAVAVFFLSQINGLHSKARYSRGNIVIAVALPYKITTTSIGSYSMIRAEGTFGADRDIGMEYTNVFSLVLDKNCKDVITFHPGVAAGASVLRNYYSDGPNVSPFLFGLGSISTQRKSDRARFPNIINTEPNSTDPP